MSIRKRLTVSSMLLVTLAVSLAAFGLWISGLQLLELMRTLVLIGDAGRLALMVERTPPEQAESGGYRVDLRKEFLQSRFDGAGADSFFQVWAADGRTLLKSNSLGERDLPRPALADHPTGIWGPGQAVREDGHNPPRTENQDMEVLLVPLGNGQTARMCWIRYSPMRGPALPPPGEADEFVVVAVATLSNADAFKERVWTASVVGAAGATIGVFWLVVRVLIQRGLRPLSTLRQRLASIDLSGDPSQRVSDANMSAETGPVVEALNTLLGRTARAIERERQFSDRAAHELRTPLTAIRATADVALRGDGYNMREALQSVSETSAHMTALLTAMIRLSRQRTSEDVRPPSRIDIDTLVRAALSRHAADLQERGVSVRIHADQDAAVIADAVAFASIVNNLVANAAEYTLDGGRIEVVTRRLVPGGVAFEIENGPTLLEDADLPHVFEPFWRKQHSADQASHAGLGLTIVHLLCDDAGMTTHVERTAAGVRFRVTIP